MLIIGQPLPLFNECYSHKLLNSIIDEMGYYYIIVHICTVLKTMIFSLSLFLDHRTPIPPPFPPFFKF